MKTLKLLFILLVSAGVINSAKAQSSFYVRGGVGIGFGLNPSVIGTNSTSSTTQNFTTGNYFSSNTMTSVTHSPGEGIYPEAAFGVMINENMGFELGFSYAAGFSTTVTNSSNGVDSDKVVSTYVTSDSTSTTATKYSYHSFLITPAFVIQGNPDNTIIPYARLGLIISIGSQVTGDQTNSSNNTNTDTSVFGAQGSSSYEYIQETTGSIQLGVNAVAGLRYKLSDNVSLYAEVNARALNFKASQSTITTYTVNGTDELSKLTPSQLTTNYVNSTSYNSNTTYGTSTPSQSLTWQEPASSVGIAIGIMIGFGGK
jgi:hypothetical protein